MDPPPSKHRDPSRTGRFARPGGDDADSSGDPWTPPGWLEGSTARGPAAGRAAAADQSAGGTVEYDVERLDVSPNAPGERADAIEERLDARAADAWRVVSVTPSSPTAVLMVFERDVEATDAPGAADRRSIASEGPWPSEEMLAVSATTTAGSAEAPAPGGSAGSATSRRRGPGVGVAALVLVPVLVAALVAVLVLGDGGGGDPVAQSPPPAATPAPPVAPEPAEPAQTPQAAAVPPCSSVTATGGEGANVVCRTESAIITLAAGSRPLLMDGLEARVFRATRTATGLTVVLRVRNTTATQQVVSDVPTRFYVTVDGRRSPASVPGGAPVPIAPGEAQTVSLRFPLEPDQLAALDGAGGRADLGVVPFGAEPDPEGPRRIGVIRLVARA